MAPENPDRRRCLQTPRENFFCCARATAVKGQYDRNVTRALPPEFPV
jgi:hypothetical protein